MKKLLSVLLAALLLAGLCGTAFADDTVYTEGYFYYTVEDGSITIVGYFGKETEVTIPSSIAGIPVNAVAADAFTGTTVTKVNLPDTVTAYQGGGAQIEVVFDANTDHPTSVSDFAVEVDPDDEELPVDEMTVDDDAVEQRNESPESASPAPASEGTDGEASESNEDQKDAEAASEDADTENAEESSDTDKNDDGKSNMGLIVAVIGGVAVAAAAVLGFRKKKPEQTETKKTNQDKE